MKIIYILILSLSTTIFAKRELIRQDYFPNGRFGFQCLDSNDCYAINQDPPLEKIFRSTDKGYTWDLIKEISKDTLKPYNMPFSFSTLKMGYVLDSNHFYFLDSWQDDYFFYTDDGFKTVQSKQICKFYRPQDFMMFDSLNGLLINTAAIFQTKDTWDTWDSIVFKDIVNYDNIFKYNDSIVFMTALKQNDDKNRPSDDIFLEYNINQQNISIENIFPTLNNNDEGIIFLEFLYFINDKIGFTGGSYEEFEDTNNDTDIIYKTTDGGDSWYKALDEFHCCFELNDVAFRDSLYGIAIESNKYYETFDGGETWQYGFFPRPEGEALHVTCEVEFAGDRCLIGSLGKGMFAWEEVPTKAVEEIGANIVVWNGDNSLRIGSDQNRLKVMIFDLLGNEVYTEGFNKNTIINASSFISGTYVFHILKDGVVVRSGKFLR